MDAALSYNFNYIEQEKSYKIINFSINIIKTIQNVPLVIIGIILVPICLIFLIVIIPLANLSLWWLNKKKQKAINELKKDITSLSYEETIEGYNSINSMIKYLATHEKEIAPDANNFLVKGIYKKFSKISAALEEIKKNLAKTLFISPPNIPYNEKEKESLDIMNDIWGDDTDQVYGCHTHYHLLRSIREVYCSKV
ncbi:MAG: hypothetical protein NTV31_15490 [Bacteroidia bacterium]|nr:hypothetical protein [Bacteroidia bacterium]